MFPPLTTATTLPLPHFPLSAAASAQAASALGDHVIASATSFMARRVSSSVLTIEPASR
jgi:hypothetical protein